MNDITERVAIVQEVNASRTRIFEDNPFVEVPLDVLVRFEELYLSSKLGDLRVRDDVGLEAKRFVEDFLSEEGVDPSDLEELLLPLDKIILAPLFKEKRGYKIDVVEALSQLDDEAILSNWTKLVQAGITPDELAKQANIPICRVEDIAFLLGRGVSATLVVRLAFEQLKEWADNGDIDELFSALVHLETNGLSHLKIHKFLKEYADQSILDDVHDKPEKWTKIGVYRRNFFREYVDANGVDILCNLPSVEDDAELARIIKAMYPSAILEAAEDYVNLLELFGALCSRVDVSLLEEKFVKRLAKGLDKKNIELAVALFINGSQYISYKDLMKFLKTTKEVADKDYYIGEIEAFKKS